MKLKNKKTGEIIEFKSVDLYKGYGIKLSAESLAELNEEWEDYVEPKEYWYIEADGSIIQNAKPDFINHLLDGLKNIGNYFETKEEAEKAVEKLKAWKRLKDKGFKFDRWNNASSGPYRPIWFYFEKGTVLEDVKSDLDLLFGGE